LKNPWSPLDVAEFNDSIIRIAKIEGKFKWHKHDNGDEIFYVLDGEFTLQTKERNFDLKKNECIVVPRGILHCPKSDSSATILLMELKDTKQYGD